MAAVGKGSEAGVKRPGGGVWRLRAGWCSAAALAATCLLLAAWASPVAGIYEDQSGMYDWYQQYIGKVTSAAFLTGGQRKRVYVATESGAVAALNLRKGDIAWRRMLGEKARALDLKLVGKYVVTLSADGVVSAWVLADGTLAWDYVLPGAGAGGGDSIPVALLTLPKGTGGATGAADEVAVLFGGRVVCLSGRTGEARWSADAAGLAARMILLSPTTLALVTLPSASSVALAALDVASGETTQTWEASSSSALEPLSLTPLIPAGAPQASLGGPVAALLTKAGDALLTLTLQAPAGAEGLVGATLALSPTPLSSLVLPSEASSGTPPALHALAIPGAAWLSVGGSRLLLSFTQGAAPQVVARSSATAALGEGLAVEDPKAGGSPMYVATYAEVERGALQGSPQVLTVKVQQVPGPGAVLTGGDKGLWRKEESFAIPAHRGNALSGLWLNAYARQPAKGRPGGGSGAEEAAGVGFRFLCVAVDHSLSLLQQEEVVWEREEALGSVVGSVLTELPPERPGSRVAAGESGLHNWLHGHWLKAKVALSMGTAEEQAAVHEMRRSTPGRVAPFRDRHGFRRLLVLLTAPGKVLGLHTGSGAVLWSTFPQPPRALKAQGAPPKQTLFLWREPPPGQAVGAPELGVLSCPADASGSGSGGGKKDTNGCWLTVLDGYGGLEMATVSLGLTAELASVLPMTDAAGRHLLLLAEHSTGTAGAGQGATPKLHLLPGSEDASDAFGAHKSKLFFHSMDAAAGTIAGYRIGSREAVRYTQAVEHPTGVPGAEAPPGFGFWQSIESLPVLSFATTAAWSRTVAGANEVVAAVAGHSPYESVHTQVRVLADREVEYRLVSRNFLFVASVSDPSGAPGVDTISGSRLTAFVLDTVTGAVLTKQVHKDASGPVKAVFCENWVVYHYFNFVHQRFEFSALELLDLSHKDDGPLPALKLALGVPGASNLTSPVSAFEEPRGSNISVLLQSYFFPYPVAALAVTQTKQGITPRRILIGTELDQILGIDRRLLDPRRKVEPSQAEKENGIIPYAPALPVDARAYLTHKHRVEGLRRVQSFPTRLESTTLIFAHGNDLFFLRLAPANVFDSLTEDFNFALLLTTITALLGAILVAWLLARQQEVRYKWR